MKTFSIYDQGSAPHREDGMFLCHPFFGVLDGVSAPYGPNYPPKMFDWMSGGEYVARQVEFTFYDTSASESFTKVLSRANRRIGNLQAGHFATRNVLGDPGELAGATFAIAKLGLEEVEIAQGGDCFALWEMTNGTVGITENQVRLHDTEMNNEILHIQREVARDLFGIALEEANDFQRGKIRGEMWNRFCPVLKEARRQDVNNPKSPRFYVSLNGQSVLDDEVFLATRILRINRRAVKTLLLFSDGMVPWEAMKGMNDAEVAAKVLADYKEGGLPHLLRIARGIEKKVAAVNYTDAAEATAIAIEF